MKWSVFNPLPFDGYTLSWKIKLICVVDEISSLAQALSRFMQVSIKALGHRKNMLIRLPGRELPL